MSTLFAHEPSGTLPRMLGRLPVMLVLALFAAHAAPGFAQTKFERPIMMDGSGDQLLVLDTVGALHQFRVAKQSLEEYRRISLPSGLVPADMSYVESDGKGSVLIAGSQEGRGIVLLYSLDGKALRTWNFRNVCSGIDNGAVSHDAYVATSDSNEIYRVNLQGGTEITFVARIPNATKLGPLAFDDAHQMIYVADVAVGAIYQYSIASKSSRVLVSDLSAPTALTFDPDTHRLFVADPGRRGIFTLDPRSDNPATAEFVSAPLKSPYAMALISGDRLAVADYGASSVLVFSGKGALLFRFPPEK